MSLKRTTSKESYVPSPSEVKYVWTKILLQTIAGLSTTGIFYSWGSLTPYINQAFSTIEESSKFENNHGTFSGVAILFISVFPVPW
jgi:hypothetical protein